MKVRSCSLLSSALGAAEGQMGLLNARAAEQAAACARAGCALVLRALASCSTIGAVGDGWRWAGAVVDASRAMPLVWHGPRSQRKLFIYKILRPVQAHHRHRRQGVQPHTPHKHALTLRCSPLPVLATACRQSGYGKQGGRAGRFAHPLPVAGLLLLLWNLRVL